MNTATTAGLLGKLAIMVRSQLQSLNCSVADTLDLIGEWWTMLIILEAFLGTRRFDDFQRNLGIARNILSTRLRKLCDGGIFRREPIHDGARRHEYRLTEMGLDLLPAVVALMQWGDHWLRDDQAPLVILDRETQQPIPRINVRAADGRELNIKQLLATPGPGATDETRERLKLLAEKLTNHQSRT